MPKPKRYCWANIMPFYTFIYKNIYICFALIKEEEAKKKLPCVSLSDLIVCLTVFLFFFSLLFFLFVFFLCFHLLILADLAPIINFLSFDFSWGFSFVCAIKNIYIFCSSFDVTKKNSKRHKVICYHLVSGKIQKNFIKKKKKNLKIIKI